MYYFASDIHLGCSDKELSQRLERRFVAWLDEVAKDAKAVFIVGDLFDFWFEYHNVVPKGYVRILAKLAELTERGIRVVMLTGNHDMWVGDYLCKECGVEIYTRPQEFEIAGKHLFVAHGDNMNIKGRPMLQLMNAIFRSKVIRFLFSWLIHPDLALWFGKWWSGSSRKSHGEERNERFLSPLVEYANTYAESHPYIDAFVFGHMHIVADIAASRRTLFMGDWATAPNYLAMDSEGNIKQIIIK